MRSVLTTEFLDSLNLPNSNSSDRNITNTSTLLRVVEGQIKRVEITKNGAVYTVKAGLAPGSRPVGHVVFEETATIENLQAVVTRAVDASRESK